MSRLRVPRLARIIFLFAALSGSIATSRADPWPEIDSDLPAHPNLKLGTLPNGLRYAILPNAEPRDRVSLRLVVAVGSLHEKDDERGMAHFVEHMAFRGTRTHPAGSLIGALQRLGIGLGPDSAAFTYYDHTAFHLEMPDAKPATFREGLQVLREFAGEVAFDPKLIELERGVVLSEFATRDTPAARSSAANLAFLWPDSRQSRRPVGGTPESIRTFTRERLVAFYDAWYRPERFAVIVVGNIEPAEAERTIAEILGGIGARASARPEPDNLAPSAASRPDVEIFSDSGLIGVLLTVEHPLSVPIARDTHARRVELLHQALAFGMFQQRLNRIAHEPGTSFLAPAVGVSAMTARWLLPTFTASGRIDDWRQVAADVEQEHRRVFQFGFTARELTEAKTAFIAGYDEAVRTSRTWPSAWLADQLAGALVSGRCFVHPADLQRDMVEAVDAASTADCLRAFRQAWTPSAPHVFISAHPSFRITRQQIAEVLNQSRAATVTARQDGPAAMPFAYEEFGPAGTLVRDEHVADLDVRLTEFTNGVRLNFKSTSFEADIVTVHLRVGEGKLLQPENRPGLDLLASYAVTAGGLGRHTAQEITSLLAGRPLSIAFHLEPDACVFTARCGRRELLLSLQLIAAFLTDAAYRPEIMRDARASFASMFAGLATAPSGPISMRAWRDLSGGDRRFGIPIYDELYSRTIDELKTWIEPQFKHGPIELSVVGDVEWSDARAAVARTLGALNPRDPRTTNVDLAVHPPAAPREPKVLAIDASLKQCAIAWFWPIPPVTEIHLERRLRFLARAMDERCRVKIREELGAAYTTSAGLTDYRGFPHLTALTVFTEVAPPHAKKAMEIIRRETLALAKSGVPADEFERIRQPFLRGRSDDLRTNIYWGTTVLGDAQQYPDRLAAARDRATDVATITRDELNQLARQFLQPEKAFRFATVPTALTAPVAGSRPATDKAARQP